MMSPASIRGPSFLVLSEKKEGVMRDRRTRRGRTRRVVDDCGRRTSLRRSSAPSQRAADQSLQGAPCAVRAPGHTRTELAEYTGLSRPTVSAVADELVQAGIVVQHEDAQPRTGRPPVLLSLASGAAFAVGVDMGHAHVQVAVCDLSGELLGHRRSLADVDHDPIAELRPRARPRQGGADGERCHQRPRDRCRHGARRSRRPHVRRGLRRGHPAQLGRRPAGGRDERAARAPGRGPQRRQPRRARRARLRRGPERLRHALRPPLGRRRPRPRARRPSLRRRGRHRGRARPHPRRSRRPDLPLRQPRLPGDRRELGGGRAPARAAAARSRSTSTACSSSSPAATAGHGVRSPRRRRRWARCWRWW